jgi:acylphosphatase
VYYRQCTKEKAIELGITGHVKNLRDGTVHITATGTEEQLSLLKEWCRKGPANAVVTTIETSELTLQEFNGFAIVRTPWL